MRTKGVTFGYPWKVEGEIKDMYSILIYIYLHIGVLYLEFNIPECFYSVMIITFFYHSLGS